MRSLTITLGLTVTLLLSTFGGTLKKANAQYEFDHDYNSEMEATAGEDGGENLIPADVAHETAKQGFLHPAGGGSTQNSEAFYDFISGKNAHPENEWMRLIAEFHHGWLDHHGYEEEERERQQKAKQQEMESIREVVTEIDQTIAEHREAHKAANPGKVFDDSFLQEEKSEHQRRLKALDHEHGKIYQERQIYSKRMEVREEGERVPVHFRTEEDNAAKDEQREMEVQAGSRIDAAPLSLRNNSECNQFSAYGAATARLYDVCSSSFTRNMNILFSTKDIWYNETAASFYFDLACTHPCMSTLVTYLNMPVTQRCWTAPIGSYFGSLAAMCKRNQNDENNRRCGVMLGVGKRRSFDFRRSIGQSSRVSVPLTVSPFSAFRTVLNDECFNDFSARFNKTHCEWYTTDRSGKACWWNNATGTCAVNVTTELLQFDCNDYCTNLYNNYTRTFNAKCVQFSGVYCAVEKWQRRWTPGVLQIDASGYTYNGSQTALTCSPGYRMCYRYNNWTPTTTLNAALGSYRFCLRTAAYYKDSSRASFQTPQSCMNDFYSRYQQHRKTAARKEARCATRPDGVSCDTLLAGRTDPLLISSDDITDFRTLAGSTNNAFLSNCTSDFYNLTLNTSSPRTLNWWAGENSGFPNPYLAAPLFKCCYEWDDYLRRDVFVQPYLRPVYSAYVPRNYDLRFTSNRTLWVPKSVESVNDTLIPRPGDLDYRFVDAANCLSNITSDAFVAEGTTPCWQRGIVYSKYYEIDLDLNFTVLSNNNSIYRDTMTWISIYLADALMIDPIENINDAQMFAGTPSRNNTLFLKDPVTFRFRVASRDPAVIDLLVPLRWRLLMEEPSVGVRSKFTSFFSTPSPQFPNSWSGQEPLCRYHTDKCGVSFSNYLTTQYIPNYQLDFERDGVPRDECFNEEFFKMYREAFFHCVISNETRALSERNGEDFLYTTRELIPEWAGICSGRCRANLEVIAGSNKWKKCFSKTWQGSLRTVKVLCTPGPSEQPCGIQYSLGLTYSTCATRLRDKCERSESCQWNRALKRCEIYGNRGDQFWEEACEPVCTRRIVSSLTASADFNFVITAMRMRGYCARDRDGDLCMPQVQDGIHGWYAGATGNFVNRTIQRMCTSRQKQRCLNRIWTSEAELYSVANKKERQENCDRGYCNSGTSASAHAFMNHYRNLATHFCDTMNPLNDTLWMEAGRRGTIYCAQAYAYWHREGSCFSKISRTFMEGGAPNSIPTCDADCYDELQRMKYSMGCCMGTAQSYCGTSFNDVYGRSKRGQEGRDRDEWVEFIVDPTPRPPTPVPPPPTPLPTTSPAPLTPIPETTTAVPPTPYPITPEPTVVYDWRPNQFSKCFKDVESSCGSVARSRAFAIGSGSGDDDREDFDYNLNERCQMPRDNKTAYTRWLSLRTGVKFSVLGNQTIDEEDRIFAENSTYKNGTTNGFYTSLGLAVRQDIAANLGIEVDDINGNSWYWAEDKSFAWIAGQARPVVPVFGRRQQLELDETGDAGSVYHFQVNMGTEEETDDVAADFETRKANNDMPLPFTVNAIESECEENECTLGTDGTGAQVEGNQVTDVTDPPVESGASSSLYSGSGFFILLATTVAMAVSATFVF